VVHQIAEVRLVIGLKVPRLYDLIASRIRNIQRRGVFILPMVPPAAWLSSYFPKLWNIPWCYKNEKNGYNVYSTTRTMIISVKLEMVWFFFLGSYIELTGKLPWIISDAFIFIIFATVIYFLVKSYRQAYE
jgi:ABC-type multidrug transport system permease subunit